MCRSRMRLGLIANYSRSVEKSYPRRALPPSAAKSCRDESAVISEPRPPLQRAPSCRQYGLGAWPVPRARSVGASRDKSLRISRRAADWGCERPTEGSAGACRRLTALALPRPVPTGTPERNRSKSVRPCQRQQRRRGSRPTSAKWQPSIVSMRFAARARLAREIARRRRWLRRRICRGERHDAGASAADERLSFADGKMRPAAIFFARRE